MGERHAEPDRVANLRYFQPFSDISILGFGLPHHSKGENSMTESMHSTDAKGFGVVGDGKIDDTNAVQVAIDACAESGGGTVDLPTGTYRVDGTLEVKDSGTLSVSGSHFWQSMNKALTAPQIAIREGTKAAVVYGNICEGDWLASNEIGESAQMGINVGS